MKKKGIKLTLYCAFILLLPIIYNYHAILGDVKNNSFDLLQKNASSSGQAIEKNAADFQEDLTYLLSTNSLQSLLATDTTVNNLLVPLQRFYSKHKELISYIKIYNDHSSRIYQKGKHNYFTLSPILDLNAGKDLLLTAQKKPGDYTILYTKQIIHHGETLATMEILLDITLFVQEELKKYYTMSNSWNWFIDEEGIILSALSTEQSVNLKNVVATELKKISNAIKENYQGAIEHSLTEQEQFDLLTAYYPIKIFNKQFGVLFSVNTKAALQAVSYRTIIITGCFIGMIVLVIVSFLLIFQEQKKTEAQLTTTKGELEEKVKERTAELQESEEKYRLLFEQSEDPMLLIDNHRFVMANPAAVKSFGYPSTEELIDTTPATHSPVTQPDGQNSNEKSPSMAATALSNGYHRFEWEFQRKDGDLFPVEVSLTRIPYRQHDALFCVWRDISSRKQAEEVKAKLERQLQQSQKMEALGLMAGGVAHDLNNILAGIVGYPELLIQKLPQNSGLQQPLLAIMDSGERAAKVVDDLLTISRDAASAREFKNLNQLITEHVDSPEHQKLKTIYPQITFNNQLEAQNPDISCSPVHVKKCLMNLITNAAEAIEGRGSVTITTRNQHITDIKTGTHSVLAGNYVVINVIDTGPGIAKKDLDHIFEPFYTKKVMGRSGTGLGLTVIWNTMKDHDGTIRVKTDEQGTCFQLFFPVSEQTHPLGTPIDAAELYPGNGERILVIDDEFHLRDIACQMLASLGYRAESVSSGEAAIDFVQENPVDLLVLDMLMEPGLGGRRTYEKILKQYPGQKAIIISGFSINKEVEAILRLGAGGFIKKPYTTEQLGRTVKEALNN